MEFENSLETKQKLVQGNIEYMYPKCDDNVLFICNEERKKMEWDLIEK